MNVGQMRDIIGEQLGHAPDLAEWRNMVRSTIAQVNRKFCGDTSREWPWMKRAKALPMYPDLRLELGVGSVVRKVGWGDRTLDIPLGDLDNVMYPEDESMAYRDHHIALEQGGEVLLADRTKDPQPGLVDYGNWAYAPFSIELAIPTSGIAPDSALVTIQLDPRAYIPALSGNEGTMLLRWPRRLLPADCASVIAIRDDQGRRLRPMSPAQMAMSEADRERIGTPCFMVEDLGAELRFGISAHPSIAMAATPHHSHTPYLWQRETWPVEETITAATVTGDSNFVDGVSCKVFVAWYWAGRYGPPSNVATVTSEALKVIRVSGLLLPPTGGVQHEYGRRLSVWMSMGEAGPYYLKGFVTSASATSYDITTDNRRPSDQRLRLPRWDEHYFDGLPKYVRIYPRPSRFMRYEVEYRAHPRALVADFDAPEIEGPHEVIAYYAAAELMAKRGGDPMPSLALAKDAERRVLAKSGLSDREDRRFGSVGASPPGRGWSYFVDENIDWRD